MTERDVMSLLNALAKNTRRDERRERKQKKPADEPPSFGSSAEIGEQRTPPPMSGATGGPAAYPLPVPVPQPASKTASGAKKRRSLFASLRGLFGGVALAAGGGLGAKFRGLFKSNKAPPPRPKPPGPQQRAERPAAAPVQRPPAPLRSRLAQADPSAAADQPPRQPPPPPQWYQAEPPPPPQPRPASQPPEPELSSDQLPPDFHRADGTHGRGRR
jgi:hypothetical protein